VDRFPVHTQPSPDTTSRSPKRFKWSSFSHQNQFQLIRVDRVQLEAVNRPVPCKHKGIRQFSDKVGKSRVKARTFSRSPVRMRSIPTKRMSRWSTCSPVTVNALLQELPVCHRPRRDDRHDRRWHFFSHCPPKKFVVFLKNVRNVHFVSKNCSSLANSPAAAGWDARYAPRTPRWPVADLTASSVTEFRFQVRRPPSVDRMITSVADPATSPLPQVLTDALRYRYTDEEREAGRRPPYPIAVALRPHRDRIMKELRSRVTIDGDTPWVVTRILLHQIRLDPGYVEQIGRDFFEFGDAACALVACAALSLDEAREIIDSMPTYDGRSLRRQIAMTLRDRDRLDEARTEADSIGAYSWSAHRDIAWKLAVEGDHEAFFKHWADYAAGKERHTMAQLKSTLVWGVAEKHGWEAAVDFAQAEKRLGAGFRGVGISQAAETMSPDQLMEFFAHEAREVITEQGELNLLVAALRRAAPRNPTSEHPLLRQIIDRIMSIDPLIDKATMRSRDSLLFGLWPVMADVETLKRVRKGMRTPWMKREFTKLPRDVVPESSTSEPQR
jgi:hypothetical protein